LIGSCNGGVQSPVLAQPPSHESGMAQTNAPPPIALLHRFAGRLTMGVRAGLVAILLVNIVLISYYVCYGYQVHFHSDAAVKNLLAQEIYQTGDYFPNDWTYVNRDLMVVFGHLYILPFLPFLDNGYALHAASGMISAGLILLATWLLSGVMTRSTWTRLLCVAIVGSGISNLISENLFGQVSYGTVFYMSCFTLFFAWRFLIAEGRVRWIFGACTIALVVLAFWANPQRAVVSYALPLMTATVLYSWLALARSGLHWNVQAGQGAILLALVALGAGIGMGLHSWVLSGVNNVAGVGAARWLSFEGMTNNMVDTIHGLLAILGGVPMASRDVMTPIGLYEGLRMITMGSVLLAMPFALAKAVRGCNEGVRFTAVFTVVSLVLFLFLHVTTSIPDMADPVSSARYLVPPVLFGLLVFVVMILDGSMGTARGVFGGAVLVVLATSAFSASHPFSLALTGRPPDPRDQLIDLLETNGLEYGYGTYWNAGALTVLSGERVKIRQVSIGGPLPTPMRHLSSERWYSQDAWHGETFLLLRNSEAETVNWELLTAYTGKPSRTLRFEDFGVYVFPRNIAAALPSWSADLATPFSIRISEASFHQVGAFDPTAGRGALVSEVGQSGYIHFGPYIRLGPGTYRAVFDIETIAEEPMNFGAMDITSGGGTNILATSQLVRLRRNKLALEFKLDHLVDDLELRVLSTGAGRMKLHGIEIASIK